MDHADWRVLWQHMRAPALSFVVLMILLGVNVLLAVTSLFPGVAYVEAFVVLLMVLTVLLVSMEVISEPPLVRVFAVLGFFWVMIMFGMTLVDYLSR